MLGFVSQTTGLLGTSRSRCTMHSVQLSILPASDTLQETHNFGLFPTVHLLDILVGTHFDLEQRISVIQWTLVVTGERKFKSICTDIFKMFVTATTCGKFLNSSWYTVEVEGATIVYPPTSPVAGNHQKIYLRWRRYSGARSSYRCPTNSKKLGRSSWKVSAGRKLFCRSSTRTVLSHLSVFVQLFTTRRQWQAVTIHELHESRRTPSGTKLSSYLLFSA